MAHEPDPRVLELLHRVDANLDRVAADLRDTIACADRCNARLTSIGVRLSRIEEGLGRIARRLGRVDERLGVVGNRSALWQRGL